MNDFSAVLGVIGFALLMWRVASTWDDHLWLTRLLGLILGLTLLVGAFVPVEDEPFAVALFALRLAAVFVAVTWTQWAVKNPT